MLVAPWRDPLRSVRSLRESYCPVMGEEDDRSDGTCETPAHAGADHQEAAGGRQAARRGPGGRSRGEAARGVGADAAPLAAAVRGPEGRRREAAEGAREGE